MAERGFILTPTHRVVAGRPEIHLYAILEDGTPALVVDDRLTPYFFVRAADEPRVRQLEPSACLTPTTLRTFAGMPVTRVEVSRPADLTLLRGRLGEAGIECFEADLRLAYRYLIDRGIRGGFTVEGPMQERPGVGRVYRNPALAPATFAPRLRVLSFDLETSLDGARLYSIAMAGAGGERVLLVSARSGVAGAETVPDERTLLARFIAHVRDVDPDVLTGWNVCDFDLPVLLRACRRAGLRLVLGRAGDEVELRRDPNFTRESRAILCGRLVLDGLALLRGAFMRLEDYRLDTAARLLLGKRKLFGPEHRGAEIEAAYRDDPAALAAYNLEDARLVLEILAKTGLIELAVRRSLLTGMQLDRVSAAIASVDSLYLGELRSRGRVAPSVGVAAPESTAIAGGLVLDSRPGLYRNILVFDFKSLYPSLIRTFNIDPLTYLPAGGDDAAIRTPGGALFRRDEPGVLPALVARLAGERAEARAAGDAVAAQAVKILMNSLFGVLGAPVSRLFSPPVANAITLAGQHVIRLAAATVEDLGHRVIYGDTDSLFVDAGERDNVRAAARAEALRGAIADAVGAAITREFGCPSHLELEFEKVYTRFFMPEVRGGVTGSKKRYAGLVAGDTGEALEVVGLEAVRRDWSLVARRFQRELLTLVFHDQPVADFVATFVTDLRHGRFDGELAYRKAVRKPLAAYTRTTPPHVQAARKRAPGEGPIVTYVVTRAGPEPVGRLTAAPDYDHYVTQQLRPVADAVLRFLDGPDFDTLTGARRQLSLSLKR